MGNSPDNFTGPREVWSAPRIEKVKSDLEIAISEAQELMASHEPIMQEAHDALVELGHRVIEAGVVHEDILRLQAQVKPDQEEVNDILKGAIKTRTALLEAYLKAKTEIEE